MFIFAGTGCKGAVALSTCQRNTHGPVRVSAELFIVTNLVIVVLVLNILRTIFAFATCHSCPCAILALAVAQLAQTLVHIIVFLTPGHEGDGSQITNRCVCFINGLFDISSIAIFVNISSYCTCNSCFRNIHVGSSSFTITIGISFILYFGSQIINSSAHIVAGNFFSILLGSSNGEVCSSIIFCNS